MQVQGQSPIFAKNVLDVQTPPEEPYIEEVTLEQPKEPESCVNYLQREVNVPRLTNLAELPRNEAVDAACSPVILGKDLRGYMDRSIQGGFQVFKDAAQSARSLGRSPKSETINNEVE